MEERQVSSWRRKLKKKYRYYIGNVSADATAGHIGAYNFALMLENGGLSNYGIQTQLSIIHDKGIFRLCDFEWDNNDIVLFEIKEEEKVVVESNAYLERPPRKNKPKVVKKTKELKLEEIVNAKFNFGKYKGVLIKDIPIEYLMWLYEIPYFYDAKKITAAQREAAMVKIRPFLKERDANNLLNKTND